MDWQLLDLSGPKAALALRKKTGLTQTQFWGRIGLTQSAGSRYECGRGLPLPVQILLTLAYGAPQDSLRLSAFLRAWPEQASEPLKAVPAPFCAVYQTCRMKASSPTSNQH